MKLADVISIAILIIAAMFFVFYITNDFFK